jgi:acyl-CoA thioester hydrolase
MGDARHRNIIGKEWNGRGCQVTFRVRYYETDKMGIVHHSNYLRWFEIARTEYLRKIGLTYRSLEEAGLGCPVIGARCQFFHSCTYDDLVTVQAWIGGYDGLRLSMAYRVAVGGQVICSGETDHAFVYNGKAVALQRSLPDIHAAMMTARNEDLQPCEGGSRLKDDLVQPSGGLA